MAIFNHRAIYVKVDGAMDYDSKSTGGIGFVIEFPEEMNKESIQKVCGRYEYANIEKLELNAILLGMNELLKVFKSKKGIFKNVNTIIVVTDRYTLSDQNRTNPYKIQEYRKNNWENYEGKSIKNKDLLDKVDKMRKKLSNFMRSSVNIEWQPRKKNKIADKLSKLGKKKIIVDKSIFNHGIKLGRRKFKGDEIVYTNLKEKMSITVRIFRKELVGNQWEINGELLSSGEKIN